MAYYYQYSICQTKKKENFLIFFLHVIVNNTKKDDILGNSKKKIQNLNCLTENSYKWANVNKIKTKDDHCKCPM